MAAFEYFADGLQRAPDLTHAETKAGFRLFFLNRPEEARRFFTAREHIPFFAMGKGAVLFLWALLTLEEADVADALASFAATQRLAAANLKRVRAAESNRSSGWFFGRSAAAEADETAPTAASERLASPASGSPLRRGVGAVTALLHETVDVGPAAEAVFYGTLEAQCVLLTAILQFVSGGIMEKLRAGISIRSVWQRYSKLEKASEAARADGQPPLPETEAMLLFGIGAFNLICSVLPPRFVRVISMLGFPSSRALGLQALHQSFVLDGAASPLSGCVILTHHTLMQSSYLYGNMRFRDEALTMCATSARRFPGSGWFLLLQGRLVKLMRDLPSATVLFEQSMAAQLEWKPLRDMCMYELAYVHLSGFLFEKSLAAWTSLFQENDWSKTFYAFMCGVCQLRLGRTADAAASFQCVRDGRGLEIQGKKLPVDLWSRRKVARYVDGDTIDLPLIHLEMLHIFAGFHTMPRELLEEGLRQVQDVQKERGGQYAPVDLRAVWGLLEGALLAQLGYAQGAEIMLMEVDKLRKQVKDETWAIYYARYELAMLWHRLDGGGSERVMAQLARAYARHDHNFDVILHVRINMAQYHAKHAVELGLQTDGQQPTVLVPAPSKAEVAAESKALLSAAKARVAVELGEAGEEGEEATLDKEAKQTAEGEVTNGASLQAPWWQGIDDPPRVTPV